MPIFWLFMSLVALFVSFLAPPLFPEWQNLQFPIGILFSVLFGLLWLRSLIKGRKRQKARPILIDGSNVMHWNKGNPEIKIVRNMVDALKTNGFDAGVIFDANVGYKLDGHYMNDVALARKLGLPVKNVMVSPKGIQADQFLLQAARDMGAPIVTNDRFRDWVDDFPEILDAGKLMRGGFKHGAPYLKSHD